jgi:hypothetical protein
MWSPLFPCQALNDFSGNLNKLKQFLDDSVVVALQAVESESRAVWIRAQTTKCECLCGRAIQARNQSKVTSRLQEFTSEFVKATKKDLKLFMNEKLFKHVSLKMS